MKKNTLVDYVRYKKLRRLVPELRYQGSLGLTYGKISKLLSSVERRTMQTRFAHTSHRLHKRKQIEIFL